MKKLLPVLLLTLGISANAQTTPLALAWSYPSNLVTTDLCFVIVTNNTLLTAASNWPVASVVPATAPQSATNGMNNYIFTIAPTNYVQFYSCAASNFVGTAWATNANPPYLPPAPTNPVSFLLNKLSSLTNGIPPTPPGLP